MSATSAVVRRFRGDGVTLVADTYGPTDAPPVVLAPGGGQTRFSWGGTAARLAQEGHYAVSLDLRGHGDSDWSPDGDYERDRFAADLRSVAAELGRPAVFIGASLGGIASLIAVSEAPNPSAVASALVLVDIAPHARPEGVKRVREFMRGAPDGFASLDEVADAIASYNPHRPRPRNLDGLRKNVRQREDGRWVWHWDPRFMSGRHLDEAGVVSREDRLERAARALALPTLLVRGGVSDLISPEDAAYFQTLVPHAEMVDVAGAGHMVAGDRNDVFTAAIVDFLHRQ